MALRRCGVAMVVVAACAPNMDARVNVAYEQVAEFVSYRVAPDSGASADAGPGAIFLLYRIREIDNSGAQAMPFVFSLQHLSVFSDGQLVNDDIHDEQLLLGSALASPISVNPGQIAQHSQRPEGLGCVVKIAHASDTKTLRGAQIDSYYEVEAAQPVSMVRINASAPEVTVQGDALPSSLQMLCKNAL